MRSAHHIPAAAAAVAVVALHAFASHAQTFSSHADLVVLHVTVTDGRRGFVAGLPREAFTVYENDTPQPITFFRNEETPVTVGLVIDSSSSMHRKRKAVIAAGLAFAKSGHADDELFTVNFNERVWTGLPPGQAFTSDLGELRMALLRSGARGRTALFDALAFALEHIEGGHQQKKVLIVLSDGGDNASTHRFEDVLDAARRSDTVIYTVGMDDQYDEDADPDVLKALAHATGAEAYFPDDTKHLTALLERIADEIRSGYTIGYVPADEREGFRSIRVDVASERDLTVRARAGYLRGGAKHGAR